MLEPMRGGWVKALVVVTVLAAGGTASAQQRERAPQRGQRPAPQQAQPTLLTEQDLGAWLTIANAAEVDISAFVQERAQTDAVAQFAEMMVQEHSDLIRQIQQAGFAPPRRTRQQPGRSPPGRYQAAYGPQGIELQTLLQQLGEKMTGTLVDELNQQRGIELDRAYMQGQVINHLAMIDTLEVFRQHARSPELQDLLDQGLESTERHLQQARRILRRLDDTYARQVQQQTRQR